MCDVAVKATLRGRRTLRGIPPFKNGDVGLHAVAAGPEDGPLVVLLHGFPEFWYSWHRQIEPLSAAVFASSSRTSAAITSAANPSASLRMPCLSSFPTSSPSPITKNLSRRTQLGRRRCLEHRPAASPELPRRFALASPVQPPGHVHRRRSRPIPRRVVAARRHHRHNQLVPRPFRTRIKFQNKTVRVPTCILWGERDDFLLTEMAHESLRYCASAELFTFANATHWLQHEEPARVSEVLINFFRAWC